MSMSVWSEKKKEETNNFNTHSHIHTLTHSLLCPSCGSSHTVLNGTRKIKQTGESTQVFKCAECHRKFSENYIRFVGQPENAQICAIEAKNLDNLTEIKTVKGDLENVKGQITQHLAKMELQGYKPATIRLSRSVLTFLLKHDADLGNPESVKEVISKQNWSGNRKRNVIVAYTSFLKYIGLTWEQPKYTIIRKLPFIPTEHEIDDLIAGTPNPLSTFLQLLKETAMRRGEAIVLPWKDVDLERKVIMCNVPEKGSNPRIFSDLSGKLLSMLNTLPKENELVFGKTTIEQLKNQLCRNRKRLAFKLGNPRLEEIHFHTLRYWKGTMLYHYGMPFLEVAEFLGHRNIENTRLYIQLEKSLFKNLPNDQFETRIAHNAEESCKLIEVGFEYVTGEYNDGGKIFRKRK
jgi:integrase